MRVLSLVVLSLLLPGVVFASSGDFKMGDKTAIVITAFGTTYEKTLKSLIAIKEDVEKAYPKAEVRFAFTSNIIRKKWNKRAQDEAYVRAHPNTPTYLYNIKNVLGVLGDLQNEGYRNIVVQSTHVANGEEFHDLRSYVSGLLSIHTFKPKYRPFEAIGLGKPLTGTYSNEGEVKRLGYALADDVAKAKEMDAALVYMGHGNEHMPQGVYYDLEIMMGREFEYPIFVGMVEGQPDVEVVLSKLKHSGKKRVLLKPLMIVAGDHANNDMAGDEDDSWKVVLTKAGYDVSPVLEGLGDKAQIRQIFVEHIENAAKKAGIELK